MHLLHDLSEGCILHVLADTTHQTLSTCCSGDTWKLGQAVSAALSLADKSLHSVAMPLIGSGIFCNPVASTAKAVVQRTLAHIANANRGTLKVLLPHKKSAATGLQPLMASHM